MPASENQPTPWKEYPEPVFPNARAREAYHRAREKIRKAASSPSPTTELNLSSERLTALPPEIGQLMALTRLDLSQNYLTALPPEIGQLTALSVLYLSYNQLTALPPEIGQLSALTELRLYNNQLTALPPEIGQLSALSVLYLSYNQLTALPPEIGQLTALTELYLSNSQLTALPPDLRRCRALRYLSLHDNPALGLPPEVLGPGPRKMSNLPANCAVVLDYYFSRQGGARPLNEIKIILTGRGGSGKTSLVDRLVWGTFDAHKKETPGISLCDWRMRDCPGGEVTGHVWDFAGQVIVRAMHQFFYSARTVYLLVLTGRENSARKDAEEFLRLIKAYGSESYLRERGPEELYIDEVGPPVLVVLNKWEDSGSARPKLDRGALQEKYPFIVDYIETDCATKYGLERLRTRLLEVVSGLEYVRAPWGKDWAAVKDALRTLTAQRQHISYAEYRKVCAQHGVTKESEQDSLAYALHALGLALNFRNDPRLCDSTVLNPHWLVEHSYGIIRWAEAHGGRLRSADLAGAMPEEDDAAMRAYMARIMERFEICYAIEGREEWLVPQSLAAESPPEALGYVDLPPGEATRLRYRYTVLPEDLVPKFIVRTHTFIAKDSHVWSTGVLLTKNGATALVRMGEEADREVNVTVRGPAAERQVLAGLILAEFRRIHETARTLSVTEETEVVTPGGPRWVNVKSLEVDEAFLRKTGVQTDAGTVMVDPVPELNEFTKPEARDDSWKPAVFISYAHADDRQMKALMLRLNILANDGLLDRRESVWHDRLLRPGEDWDGEIKSQLERADIIVLLISAASRGSTYIHNTELKRALERAAAGEVVAVPIILDGTDWKHAEYPELDLKLSRFQALCADKPVLKHSPQRDAWEKVEVALRGTLTKLKARGPRRR